MRRRRPAVSVADRTIARKQEDVRRGKAAIESGDAAMKQKLRAPDGLFWDALYPNIEVSKFKWSDGAMQNAACVGTLFACKPDRTDLPPPQLLPPSPHICAWLFNNKQGVMIDRDRGEPCGSAPPTPPYIRVRIRRFDGLSCLVGREGS